MMCFKFGGITSTNKNCWFSPAANRLGARRDVHWRVAGDKKKGFALIAGQMGFLVQLQLHPQCL